ncbi:MAG: NFACT family protein [Clostridiales bacterium]|nr:NFACT family protein [Clostridiales bacterium]
MAFDGLILKHTIEELRENIIHSKIDKIFQPEEDEIHIQFRNKLRLKFSINASMPYLTLTKQKKINPQSPPNFLILLRKYLTGAVLTHIEQSGMDRIVFFTFFSRNEMGDDIELKLIYELMGKHSNLIMVNHEDIIIDSLKRVPPYMSHVRQILPNLKYFQIENDQLDIQNIPFDLFNESISDKNEKIFKVLYQVFEGFSPSLTKELISRCNIDPNENALNLNVSQKNILYMTLIDLNVEDYYIFLDNDGFYKDFHIKNLKVYNSFTTKSSILELIDDFYNNKDVQLHIKQKSTDLRKLVENRIKRVENKIEGLQKELAESLESEAFKIKGELILSNIYQIQSGMESITVYNYYSENDLLIELDPQKTPQENSQLYYQKYNKMKTAKIYIENQLKVSKDEFDYLQSIMTSIDNTLDNDNLELIKDELISEGYLKKKGFKKSKKIISKPNEYISNTGFIISVGKNNKENDILTFKKSSNSDLWFHTKNIPGSHVVISTQGKEPDNETIVLAAELAAFNSKSKYSSTVPVDFTEIRHVKKPSGAKPGFVNYFHQKTIYVTPNEEKINQHKKEV